MLFIKQKPKIMHLREKLYETYTYDEPDTGAAPDEVDRIPRELIVERYHIVCFCISILSYFFDIGSDIYVGVSHFAAGRKLAAVFISSFAFIPSIIQNVIFLAWELNDYHQRNKKQQDEKKSRKEFGGLWLPLHMSLLLSFLQLGPVWMYYKTIYYGLKFRRCKTEKERRFLFCKMIEAERDATLLRLFEGFLESAPQLIIQSIFLYEFLWFRLKVVAYSKLPRWVYFQLSSLCMSLFSLCWSMTSQHRTIRIATPDKGNVHPHETVLQLLWRSFTILSRILTIGVCIMYFKYYTLLLAAAHYLFSLAHITVLQSLDFGYHGGFLEIGMHLINAFVHTFAPFNTAEGQTRWRYFAAYFIELIEGIIVYYFVLFNYSFHFTWKWEFALVSLASYCIGILFMIIYYTCFHPNRRKQKLTMMIDGEIGNELYKLSSK